MLNAPLNTAGYRACLPLVNSSSRLTLPRNLFLLFIQSLPLSLSFSLVTVFTESLFVENARRALENLHERIKHFLPLSIFFIFFPRGILRERPERQLRASIIILVGSTSRLQSPNISIFIKNVAKTCIYSDKCVLNPQKLYFFHSK